MSTLVVTARPDPGSLTHHLSARLRATLPSGTVETADLAAEGVAPRFTLADRHTHRTGTDAPTVVVAEQQCNDRATDLVLVFPG